MEQVCPILDHLSNESPPVTVRGFVFNPRSLGCSLEHQSNCVVRHRSLCVGQEDIRKRRNRTLLVQVLSQSLQNSPRTGNETFPGLPRTRSIPRSPRTSCEVRFWSSPTLTPVSYRMLMMLLSRIGSSLLLAAAIKTSYSFRSTKDITASSTFGILKRLEGLGIRNVFPICKPK